MVFNIYLWPMQDVAPSFWEKSAWYRSADYMIVGAGFLGLWTAIEIKRQKPTARVLVLERSDTMLGASSRNAGFSCFGSPSELLQDAEQMGLDEMLQVVQRRYLGIQKIQKTFNLSSIAYEACGGFECYTAANAVSQQQIALLNGWLQQVIPLNPVFEWATEKLDNLSLQGFTSLVENKQEAALHSGLLCQQLSLLAVQTGVELLHGLPVIGYERSGNGIALHTHRGIIMGVQVLFATNAWQSLQFPTLGIVPARGQVLVSKPIENLKLFGTFHFDEGYYYWRHVGNRVLLGGARNIDFEQEQTLELEVSTTIQHQLEAFLVTHLPAYFNEKNIGTMIEFRWAGIMARTPDKRPLCKQLEPGLWVANCCNGMGVAIAPIHAETVCEMLLTN